MDSQDPSVLWNRTWDSTGTEYAYRIWVGGDAIYTQGSSNSDHLLVKWDKDGNQIWNRTWGGSGTEYLGGIWGDGTSIYTCGQTLSWGLSNPYILKYDLSGNLIWNRTCNLRSNANGIWGVGEYLYVAGAFYNSVNYDVILIKFDSVGNVIWNRTFGYSPTSSDGATAVWGTGNEIYTCGAFSIPGSNEDMLFVKWDSNGNLVWNRTWGDPGSNFPSDIWGNEDGIYITGVSNRYNVWDMDGLMLLKYNSSGDLEWYKLFNSPIYEIGYGIAGNNDSIFTIGRCGSPFNNTIDALLIKWDLEGNQVSNHTWGGGTSNEYGYDVAEDGEFVYTCGEGLTGFFLAKWDLIGYQLMVSLSANMTFAEPGEFIQFKYTGSQSYDLSCQWNFGDGTSNSSEKNPLVSPQQ
nr:hypothetical protein [Candidatus Sigynarchaeota archaeon]